MRSPTFEDYQQAVEIYKRNGSMYDFDPFKKRSIIDDAVVLKDGRVIAYGMVQLFAEAVLVMDPLAGRIERTKALKDLMNLACNVTAKQGITQLHTFTNEPKFNDLLIEQFGFERITSMPLVKDL